MRESPELKELMLRGDKIVETLEKQRLLFSASPSKRLKDIPQYRRAKEENAKMIKRLLDSLAPAQDDIEKAGQLMAESTRKRLFNQIDLLLEVQKLANTLQDPLKTYLLLQLYRGLFELRLKFNRKLFELSPKYREGDLWSADEQKAILKELGFNGSALDSWLDDTVRNAIAHESIDIEEKTGKIILLGCRNFKIDDLAVKIEQQYCFLNAVYFGSLQAFLEKAVELGKKQQILRQQLANLLFG